MKIAYIIEWDIYEDSGVLKKINSQINEWRLNGSSAYPVLISPKRKKKSLIDGKLFTSAIIRILPNGFIANYLNKITTINKVSSYLKELNPDIVYIRQNIWYPGLDKVLSRYDSVMELNTDDVKEIKLLGGVKPTIYFYGRNKLISSIQGFVSVSEEIAQLYKKFKKPIVTIGNGITIEKGQSLKKDNRYAGNNIPQIIFVGTPNQPWHGIDKILLMAEHLSEFSFHIVGCQNSFQCQVKNIEFHGYKNSQQLKELYQSMDIGIGTLALHRKGMHEASPLKTREYLLNNLPMIVGFTDTDLDGQDFILNIGNYENNVTDNIDNIRTFVQEWKRKSLDASPYLPLIDYKEKEKKRLSFFRSLLHEVRD